MKQKEALRQPVIYFADSFACFLSLDPYSMQNSFNKAACVTTDQHFNKIETYTIAKTRMLTCHSQFFAFPLFSEQICVE